MRANAWYAAWLARTQSPERDRTGSRLLATTTTAQRECHCAQPWIYRMRPHRWLEIGASGGGPAASVGKSHAAVLSQAGAPLSWTSERANTLFRCKRMRTAAASNRQPQRAERAMCKERERRRSFLCERRRSRRIRDVRAADLQEEMAEQRFSVPQIRRRRRHSTNIAASGASIKHSAIVRAALNKWQA